MDIYITDLGTGDRLQFPMLPEAIRVTTAAQFYNYNIINIGEIRLPSGEALSGISWSGMLPGERRKNEPFVKAWAKPQAIHTQWSVYRNKKKKLRLMITETAVNMNVYLSSYTLNYENGYGDINYSIDFIQAKDLKVYASGVTGKSSGTAATVENKPEGEKRPSPPPAETYTVKKGDTLWAIAQKQMGAGSRYGEIFDANKDTVKNANLIYPGQVLTIPT